MFGRFKNRQHNNNQSGHHQRGNGWNNGRRRKCKIANSIVLTETKENKDYQVVFNSQLKLIEMGLFAGAKLTVVKNDSSNPNIIVNVSDSKYMISKEIAEDILVIGISDDFERCE